MSVIPSEVQDFGQIAERVSIVVVEKPNFQLQKHPQKKLLIQGAISLGNESDIFRAQLFPEPQVAQPLGVHFFRFRDRHRILSRRRNHLAWLFSERGLKLTNEKFHMRVYYCQLWLNKLLHVLLSLLRPLLTGTQVRQTESGLAQVLILPGEAGQHPCQRGGLVTGQAPTPVVDAHRTGVRLATQLVQLLGQVPFEQLIRPLKALVNACEVVGETILHLSGLLF